MLLKLQHLFRPYAIVMAMAVLVFGIGWKTNLCFMPNGEVHMEEGHFVCGLAGSAPVFGDLPTMHSDQAGNHNLCLDVSLEGDSASQRLRSIVQIPLPLILPSGSSILFASKGNNFSVKTSAIISSQPLSLQRIILRV